MKTDYLYKLSVNTREMMRRSFKALTLDKNVKTFELLGYTPKEMYNHLSKGKYRVEDYSSKNLHLDHIIPLKYFIDKARGKTQEQQEKIIAQANSLANIRLIPASENLLKNDKIDMELIKDLGIGDLL